jgi:hypothetical protein
MTIALVIQWIVVGYLVLGIVFACFFLVKGINQIDPAAHGSSWFFRLLLVPGVTALWPMMARLWWKRSRP